MKKMACLMVVAVLLAVSMVPAFAASGINTCEKEIIQYVKTAYVVDGKTITVPQEYITALENVFTAVDVTEEQHTQIKAILDEALAFCKKNNLTTLNDITKTNSAEALIAYANRALGVVGAKVSTQGSLSDADHGLLIITTADGQVFKLHPAVITKTGADYTSAAVCGVVALAVLAAAGVSVKAFRKESDED